MKIEAKQKISKDLQDAVDEKQAYIEMYQSGYLDGWKHRNYMAKPEENRLWQKIALFAKVAFEKRYFAKIEKTLKDVKNGDKKMHSL